MQMITKLQEYLFSDVHIKYIIEKNNRKLQDIMKYSLRNWGTNEHDNIAL